MALDDHRHPDAERLAEYAEGTLDVPARAEVERHLANCADCRAVVMETVAFLEANPASHTPAATVIPFRSRRSLTGVAAVLAVAAMLVLAVFLARPEWLSRRGGDRPELQELIAAVANEPTRPVEGRMSGGFKYAPPPSPTRGARDREVSPEVRIAAAKIEQLSRERRSAENDALLGRAYLALGRSADAIEALTRAGAAQPRTAALDADLAAAYLRRCADEASACRAAVASAERALDDQPGFPPALFNRALALEMLGRREDAASAWRRYLEADGGSAWSVEARAHLSGLEASR